MNNYIKRFANPGTLLAILSVLGMLGLQFGLDIDMAWLDATGRLLCSLGVLIGIINNPTTPGIDLPFISKPEE